MNLKYKILCSFGICYSRVYNLDYNSYYWIHKFHDAVWRNMANFVVSLLSKLSLSIFVSDNIYILIM